MGTGLCTSTVGHAGWNHLVRAALQLLLPLECAGVEPPWRLGQLKEKLGRLTIYHNTYRGERTGFRLGVSDLLSRLSQKVCIRCGQPGKMRSYGRDWMRPECGRCWQASGRT